MKILKELCHNKNIKFEYYLYADDMVFIIKHRLIPSFLSTLQKVLSNHDLILNPNKCAIVKVKNHKGNDEGEINYLGIKI